MKITYVITRGDEYYGAQKYVFDQATQFSKKHQVTVITGHYGILNNKLTNAGIKNYHIRQFTKSINPLKDFIAFIRLLFLLKKLNTDIISAHSSKAGILVRALNPFVRARIVFTVHGWSFTATQNKLSAGFYSFIEYFFQFFCARIIVESEENKRLGIRNKIREKKISVIESGVARKSSLDKIKEKYSRFPLTDYTLNIITIAGFRPQKDYENMIKAILYYSANINDRINFYIYGNGPQRNYFEKMVSNSGCSNIYFEGEYDNPEEVFARANVLLLLSHYEGLPLAILEALSFGLPVICSNVGGNADAVSNGYNGYIIDNNTNHKYIADCLDKFSNIVALKDFSFNSFTKWEQHFNIENTFARIDSLFTEI